MAQVGEITGDNIGFFVAIRAGVNLQEGGSVTKEEIRGKIVEVRHRVTEDGARVSRLHLELLGTVVRLEVPSDTNLFVI